MINKLQVLAIHGYRQSDSIFSGKLGSLRKSFKQKIDFVFVRAPHLVPPLETVSNEPDEPVVEGFGAFRSPCCIHSTYSE